MKQLFATTARGFEELLKVELTELVQQNVKLHKAVYIFKLMMKHFIAAYYGHVWLHVFCYPL